MKPLWQPSAERAAATELARFMRLAGCDSYDALHAWSVERSEAFWNLVWDFCAVKGEKGAAPNQICKIYRQLHRGEQAARIRLAGSGDVDPEALPLEALPHRQERGVHGRRQEHPVSAGVKLAPGPSQPRKAQMVGFGASRAKDKVEGLGPYRACDSLAAVLENGPRRAPFGVGTARIASPHQRFADGRRDSAAGRTGRIEVQVDAPGAWLWCRHLTLPCRRLHDHFSPFLLGWKALQVSNG